MDILSRFFIFFYHYAYVCSSVQCAGVLLLVGFCCILVIGNVNLTSGVCSASFSCYVLYCVQAGIVSEI